MTGHLEERREVTKREWTEKGLKKEGLKKKLQKCQARNTEWSYCSCDDCLLWRRDCEQTPSFHACLEFCSRFSHFSHSLHSSPHISSPWHPVSLSWSTSEWRSNKGISQVREKRQRRGTEKGFHSWLTQVNSNLDLFLQGILLSQERRQEMKKQESPDTDSESRDCTKTFVWS